MVCGYYCSAVLITYGVGIDLFEGLEGLEGEGEGEGEGEDEDEDEDEYEREETEIDPEDISGEETEEESGEESEEEPEEETKLDGGVDETSSEEDSWDGIHPNSPPKEVPMELDDNVAVGSTPPAPVVSNGKENLILIILLFLWLTMGNG